jgi:peptidyl-prolyl cis-trans isomerase C
MRRLSLTTASAALALACVSPALAQTRVAGPGQTSPQTVLATVNGDPIRISDVMATIETQVPPQLVQQMPKQVLFQKVLEQLIDQKALIAEARKQGLDRDPQTQHEMQAAAERVLVQAELRKAVTPQVNEEAIKAAYDKEYAGKPGETEIHARHILVDSEAKAKDIIAQLDHGAKFEDLARKYGDPKDAATQNGGDLGFFKKGDMVPDFSNAAFALKPNQYTKTPVHTRYGYHVIQVLETRISQPPTYDATRTEIGQKLQQDAIKQAIEKAKANAKVVMVAPIPAAAPAPKTGK